MPRDGVIATAELDQLGRTGLKAAWEEAFGSPPPPYLSVGFMRKALASTASFGPRAVFPHRCAGGWRRPPGATSAARLQRLRSAPAPTSCGSGTAAPNRVEVLANGYRMDGRTYRSLSAVARGITGTAWSGPRFFGIADRKGSS